MTKRSFSFSNNPLLAGPGLDERAKGSGPYREIALSAIEKDASQPRQHFDPDALKELAESIRLYGVISPILIRQAKLPGRFTIISGERRFRAAQIAGLATIPAIVSSGDDTDGKTLAIQLVENIQRADLSPLERAHAIGALRDAHQLSVRDIAEKLSISKSAVQRSLEILELPDDLLSALRDGAAESKILLLAKISDEKARTEYLKNIDTITRSQLERDITPRSASSVNADVQRVPSAEDIRIADEIQRAIGMRVKLNRSHTSANNGKLTIEFNSDADLQFLFRLFMSDAASVSHSGTAL